MGVVVYIIFIVLHVLILLIIFLYYCYVSFDINNKPPLTLHGGSMQLRHNKKPISKINCLCLGHKVPVKMRRIRPLWCELPVQEGPSGPEGNG